VSDSLDKRVFPVYIVGDPGLFFSVLKWVRALDARDTRNGERIEPFEEVNRKHTKVLDSIEKKRKGNLRMI